MVPLLFSVVQFTDSVRERRRAWRWNGTIVNHIFSALEEEYGKVPEPAGIHATFLTLIFMLERRIHK